jgi:ubiquinone/menaquinone biosynthesis C-methylase UbiE
MIMNDLGSRLPEFDMLDIGIGAGRTTRYFTPLVRTYVGIDYSKPMVDVCRNQFRYDFRLADARDLHIFSDSSFDFVLFSFNGLDNILFFHERTKALNEIRRVLKTKGWFIFSSHNLNWLQSESICNLLPYRGKTNFGNINRTLTSLRRMFRKELIKIINGYCFEAKKSKNFDLIREGGKLMQFYTRPKFQMEQLSRTGFECVGAYGLKGQFIKTTEFESTKDAWIYYLNRAI